MYNAGVEDRMALSDDGTSSFRIAGLPPYLLGNIAEAVLKARLQGRDIIDLSQVNPDNPPPRHALDKLIQATLHPHNHRYSSSQGIRRLRQAGHNFYNARFGVELDVESEVVVGMGTKEALVHLLQAMVNPGETIVVPTPAYPVHLASVYLSGASSVGIQLPIDAPKDALKNAMADSSGSSGGTVQSRVLSSDDTAFFEQLELLYKTVYPHPRVLICSFPHNPTTTVVDYSFWERLVAFARRYRVYIVHDFAYSTLFFDGYRPVSVLQVPGAKDVAVELLSLSKGFGIPGWRIGLVVGNANLVNALKKIKSYIDFGIFQPLQIAAASLLEQSDVYLEDVRLTYQNRRDLLVDGLKSIGWSPCLPLSTVFVWSKLPAHLSSRGSMSVALEMLRKNQVALCPGVGFGEAGEGYVRISLVEEEDRLKEAVARIGRFSFE